MSDATMTDPSLHVAPQDRDLATSLARPEVRDALTAQLPVWLRPKRWFGGQIRQLTAVQIEGWLSLGDDTAPAVLCVIRVTDSDAITSRHPLFLAAAEGGTVGEALELPIVRQRLLELLLNGGELRGTGLRLIGEPTGAAAGLAPNAPSRIIGAQQSNSSLVYGEQAIMKVYRRLESGANPEIELGRFLSVEAGLAAIPRVYASGRLVGDGTTLPEDFDAALLILQAFVPNEGDGWEWSLAQGGAALAAATDADELTRWLAAHPALADAATELGRTTARMHAALATATGANLAPHPTTAADVAAWASAVGQEAQETTAALARSGLDDATLARAVDAAQVYPPPAVAAPGLLTRVHGDYHLGQIIRGAAGFMILDFEGEPARPLAYRRRHQHPLADVAGMTRSWSYAAHAATEGQPGKEPLAAALEAALRERFLAAYWAEADAAQTPFLPPDTAGRLALLRLFELAKALYEVRYELNNRPAMVNIPGDAVKRLMGQDE
ncbi:MAG TPA: hypothetical protein VIL85_02315 [Thermomicrobiales bacterium]|jgi:maltose alpha-D-glucosyltransferase/alpha-amylase